MYHIAQSVEKDFLLYSIANDMATYPSCSSKLGVRYRANHGMKAGITWSPEDEKKTDSPTTRTVHWGLCTFSQLTFITTLKAKNHSSGQPRTQRLRLSQGHSATPQQLILPGLCAGEWGEAKRAMFSYTEEAEGHSGQVGNSQNGSVAQEGG